MRTSSTQGHISANPPKSLALRNLCIANGDRILLEGVGFEIVAGQTTALMGASGSGKSLSALALQGIIARNLRLVSGEVLLNGRVLNEREIAQGRGKLYSSILQNPRTCFNPLLSLKSHIKETLNALGKGYVSDEVECALSEVGLESSALTHYPHELSGGMLQRAMIAISLLSGARFIIADEATTDLDMVVERRILELLKRLQKARGLGLLLISHDRRVVEFMSDRVCRIERGRMCGGEGNLPASIHLSGCNLSSGDSFEKSHCPASLDEREMFYLRSQGNEISQSNTANTSIVGGNGEAKNNAHSPSFARKSPFSTSPAELPLSPSPSDEIVAEGALGWVEFYDNKQNALIAHNVSKSFSRYTLFGRKQKRVLRAVSLRVGERERVALLGRSGSGKSTLAKILSGLEGIDFVANLPKNNGAKSAKSSAKSCDKTHGVSSEDSEFSADFGGVAREFGKKFSRGLSEDFGAGLGGEFSADLRGGVYLNGKEIWQTKPRYAQAKNADSKNAGWKHANGENAVRKNNADKSEQNHAKNNNHNAGQNTSHSKKNEENQSSHTLASAEQSNALNLANLAQRREFYKQVQILFQDPIGSLNPRLTLRESLCVPLRYLLGLQDRQTQEARILPLLARMGLDEGLLEAYPAMLSGGQAARFCLARALLARPKYIILDESTSSLDERAESEILALLKELQEEEGLGVLLITHSARLARKFCEKIYIMESGEIIEEVLGSEPFRSDFGAEIDRLSGFV